MTELKTSLNYYQVWEEFGMIHIGECSHPDATKLGMLLLSVDKNKVTAIYKDKSTNDK